MRFYTKKRRTPAIIIVSLIDILAILLIFFIVTTTFNEDQPRLQINLPESKTAESGAAESGKPLVLRVKSEQDITLGDTPVALDGLASALSDSRKKNPDRALALQADRDAPFGVVVKVLDALKSAGISNVPTFTQPQSQTP